MQRAPRRNLVVVNVFEKFSERSIKSVMIAQTEAKNLGASEVTTEHVLLGLIAEGGSPKTGYLNSGLTLDRVRGAVEAISGRRKPNTSSDSIPFSREVRKTFEAATNECKRSAATYISPEHILLAMLSYTDSLGARVLDSLGVDAGVLRAEASQRIKGEAEAVGGRRRKAQGDKDPPKMLDEFCKDLCAEVRAGRVDPMIGRASEVSRVMQILARRTKNNPILLGEPGVGKTAIAEGLAHAIVHNGGPDGTPLPPFLRSKRVMQLDVGLLIAGAKERGELENRVTRMMQEMREGGDVILMIDEVHTLVGAGSVGRGGGGGGGGLDISNLIKPALARGELQCIGATTVNEHRKYIEKDTALERRFQPVYVDEPSEVQSLEILAGLRERYERHHRCVYSEEALVAAVRLSSRYIADRFLPDKAIDVLDEAGSRVRVAAYDARCAAAAAALRRAAGGRAVPAGKGAAMAAAAVARREDPKIQEYLQVLETKDEAVKDGLYEEAFILRRREMDYKAELVGPPTTGSRLPVVGVSDIEAVVAAWSGIPVERMTEDETAKLMRLGDALKSQLVGQDDAVDSLVAALRRARCGLQDPRRPLASLLFVGPTGVGKTGLTKVLAQEYFGSQDAILRLDMSEYMERHSVSKLIGAPPGYVGFGEGGKLTEAVRRRPCSIVLFDEIEKAHPDVFTILLQIMEDGRLTDSQGRVVSFKNTLVLLTSNIGSRVIAASASGAGAGVFGAQRGGAAGEADEEEDAAAEAANKAQLSRVVLDEVRSYFRPELLNRFDEQVVFHKLSPRSVVRIAELMMAETKARVAERGHELVVSPRLMERIVAEGYSHEYGVRPLRQVITQYIDDVLSDAILSKRLAPGATAYMDLHPASGGAAVYDSPQPPPDAEPVLVVAGSGRRLRGEDGGGAGGAGPWVLASSHGGEPGGEVAAGSGGGERY